MPADTTTVPSSYAVRAALEICQVLRQDCALSGEASTLDRLVIRTGLDPDLVLWGIRILEEEGLANVWTSKGGLRVAPLPSDMSVNVMTRPTPGS